MNLSIYSIYIIFISLLQLPSDNFFHQGSKAVTLHQMPRHVIRKLLFMTWLVSFSFVWNWNQRVKTENLDVTSQSTSTHKWHFGSLKIELWKNSGQGADFQKIVRSVIVCGCAFDWQTFLHGEGCIITCWFCTLLTVLNVLLFDIDWDMFSKWTQKKLFWMIFFLNDFLNSSSPRIYISQPFGFYDYKAFEYEG